jgi:hypothetical protein
MPGPIDATRSDCGVERGWRDRLDFSTIAASAYGA